MLFAKIVLIGCAIAAGGLVLWLLYNVSDKFHVFVRRLFGARAIAIKGRGPANRRDLWTAILERDAWGEPFAYRYPSTRVGVVDLRHDGTGDYCGPVVWVPLGWEVAE